MLCLQGFAMLSVLCSACRINRQSTSFSGSNTRTPLQHLNYLSEKLKWQRICEKQSPIKYRDPGLQDTSAEPGETRDRLEGGGRGLALQFIRTGLEHLGLTNSGIGEVLKTFPGWSEDGLSHFTTEKPTVQKRCDSIAWVSSETILTCKALLMLSLRMWAFCACCNCS